MPHPISEATVLPLLISLALLADSTPSRRVEVAPGETLNAVIAGQGPPVVLVNGLIGGAFGFRQVIAGLVGGGYQVIAIEPLGLGYSARPKQANYSLTAQADRIAMVLDTLGVHHALVIAHSLGGSMALRLAYRHPALVRGVLLIDAGPAESATTVGLRRAMRWAPLLKLFVGRGTIRRQVHKELVKNSADTTWLTADALEGYIAPSAADVGATIDAFRGMTRAAEPELLTDHLHAITAPVRLLVGTAPHESAVDDSSVAKMERAIPDFAVHHIPGCGQLIHEEQPATVLRALAGLDSLAAPPR